MNKTYEELMKEYNNRDQLDRHRVDEAHQQRVREGHERDVRRREAHRKDVIAEEKARAEAEHGERIIERDVEQPKPDGKIGQEQNAEEAPTATPNPNRYATMVATYTKGGEKDAADRLDRDSIGRAPTYKHVPDTLRDEDDTPERTLYTD